MNPMPESKLKGKYVEFRDKNDAYRIGKVLKIYPKHLTIETFQPSSKTGKRTKGVKVRVLKTKVLRRILGNKNQDILWGE